MEVRPLEIATRRVRLADLVELTKPRITFLVLITTLVGFYMGSDRAAFASRFSCTQSLERRSSQAEQAR